MRTKHGDGAKNWQPRRSFMARWTARHGYAARCDCQYHHYGYQHCGRFSDRGTATWRGVETGAADLHDSDDWRWIGDGDSGVDDFRSGGLIVTRASSESRLSTEVQKQLFNQAQPLMLAAGVLIVLAAFPGLPKIPFLALGAGTGYAGWKLREKEQKAKQTIAATALARPKEDIESLLKVEPLAIEVGLGLVRFVEGGLNSILLKRIAAIRKQFASEMGYLLPPVRVTDNVQLKAREYVIHVKGIEVARYELQAGCELAIQPCRMR